MRRTPLPESTQGRAYDPVGRATFQKAGANHRRHGDQDTDLGGRVAEPPRNPLAN